jgi:hypothetical protein
MLTMGSFYDRVLPSLIGPPACSYEITCRGNPTTKVIQSVFHFLPQLERDSPPDSWSPLYFRNKYKNYTTSLVSSTGFQHPHPAVSQFFPFFSQSSCATFPNTPHRLCNNHEVAAAAGGCRCPSAVASGTRLIRQSHPPDC